MSPKTGLGHLCCGRGYPEKGKTNWGLGEALGLIGSDLLVLQKSTWLPCLPPLRFAPPTALPRLAPGGAGAHRVVINSLGSHCPPLGSGFYQRLSLVVLASCFNQMPWLRHEHPGQRHSKTPNACGSGKGTCTWMNINEAGCP